jgi:hypothetical protein
MYRIIRQRNKIIRAIKAMEKPSIDDISNRRGLSCWQIESRLSELSDAGKIESVEESGKIFWRIKVGN